MACSRTATAIYGMVVNHPQIPMALACEPPLENYYWIYCYRWTITTIIVERNIVITIKLFDIVIVEPTTIVAILFNNQP